MVTSILAVTLPRTRNRDTGCGRTVTGRRILGEALDQPMKTIIKEPLINNAIALIFGVTGIPLRFPPMLIASRPIFGAEWGVFPLFQTQFTCQA